MLALCSSIRIEVNGRTSSWYLSIACWHGEPHILGIGDQNTYSLIPDLTIFPLLLSPNLSQPLSVSVFLCAQFSQILKGTSLILIYSEVSITTFHFAS